MESQQSYQIKTQPLERMFTNPICQNTFISLPRIYGLKGHQYKRRHKPLIQYSVKQCKACDLKMASPDEKLKERNSSLSRMVTKSQKYNKQRFDNLRSLSNTNNNKSSHLILKKLREMQSLTERQSDHKISYNTGMILPPITRSSEDILPWQKETNIHQFFSKQIKPLKSIISPIHEAVDEDRSGTPEPSLYLRKNETRYLSQPPAQQSTKQLKQIGIQISLLNESQAPKHIARQDTYFRQFINKQRNEGLKDSQSYRSATSNSSYVIPSKCQIGTFIETYKSFDPSFDLKNLLKNKSFQVVSYRNGIYLGEYENKQKNGKGVFITEKYIFEGSFVNGFKSYGSQCTNEGVYTGELVNGLREGKGTFKWHNGEIYEGTWKQGMKHGKGIWKSKSGDSYDGEWNCNKQQGYGIHRHSISTYEGYFKNFLKHGQGKQNFSKGDIYQGQYSEGKPNGFGKYRWKNGSVYEGQFMNGFRQGQGTLTQNGDIYKGHFTKDVKDGIGFIMYSDGSIYNGQFHNDQPLQSDSDD